MTMTARPWHIGAHSGGRRTLARVFGTNGHEACVAPNNDDARRIVAAVNVYDDVRAFLLDFVADWAATDHDADHDGPDETRCTMDNPQCRDMQARALFARMPEER